MTLVALKRDNHEETNDGSARPQGPLASRERSGGPLSIDTPLGPGAIVLRRMHGGEALSTPFSYRLELVSAEPVSDWDTLLGESITVHLELGGDQFRHFHGIVTTLRLLDHKGSASTYEATMESILSVLALRTNSRVFQHENVPAIVKEILREHGFADIDERLCEEYPALEYVVQYNESDLNFVSRLLERAGIYYFFTHQPGKHTLVLADSQGAHDRMPGCERLPYCPPSEHRDRFAETVRRWQVARTVKPGKVTLRDYNYRTSLANLEFAKSYVGTHPHSDVEAYQYPGKYQERAAGEGAVDLRMEQIRAEHEATFGETNARNLQVGTRFELTEHPEAQRNREYLVTFTELRLEAPAMQSGPFQDAMDGVCSCDFAVLETSRQFRPTRSARKPKMSGPQTAVVVGAPKEDIFTNDLGCVKIQFHWDRYGQLDQNSSCWVRVAQAWAGNGWGSICLPRVGQEVIVDFLDGDPDRPIITGRVYNDMNSPPYELPKHRSQSGIKTRSTNQGGPDRFNEIRFEDKKGHEDLLIHAERTQTTVVEASQSVSVGGAQSVNVGGDQTVHVTGNRAIRVDGAGEGKVQSSLIVDGAHRVNASDMVEIDARNHVKLFTGPSFIKITPDEIKIQCGESWISLNDNGICLQAGKQARIEMKDVITATAKEKATFKVSDAVTLASPSGGALSIKGDVVVQAKDASVLALKEQGAVELFGKQSVGVASATVTLSGAEGKGAIELGAAGATMTGQKATLSSAGTTEITGLLVRIN